MNPVPSILPIDGVPEELLRALNDRFRQLVQDSPQAVSGSTAGLIFTHANRASANLTAVGTYGTETDRTVVYQVRTVGSAKAWVYVSGVMKADFADEPTDLGPNDVGFLWEVTDYAHVLRWMGTGWEFTDAAGGYFAFMVAVPDGNAWALCDGTATKYLHVDGSGVAGEVSITPPNLATTNAGYLKTGAAYTGAANAAVVPVTGAPSTVALAIGAGAANASSIFHTHAITLPGDPVKNVVCLPYLRR